MHARILFQIRHMAGRKIQLMGQNVMWRRCRRKLIAQHDVAILETIDRTPCEFEKRSRLIYDKPNDVRALSCV